MKKLVILIAFFFMQTALKAANFTLFQLMQTANYTDINLAKTRKGDIVDFQPVYLTGYYFADARFQNIGKEQWVFRGLFNATGSFLNSKYKPDLRYAYVENKKPLADHWFLSGGLINPSNLVPVQRLLGGHVAFTPNPDKNWLFGIIGGMVPAERSGFRDYYYAPYRIGAYAEYNNKNADHWKLQYNAGIGAGTTLFHQGQMEVTKKYSIFSRDSFIRGGIVFTYPYNTFDYLFAENSFYQSQKIIHSIGYLKSETLFLWSNSYLKQDFQQAFYRLGFRSNDSTVLLNIRGGYTYSLGIHGYIFQGQIMKRSLFKPNIGMLGFDALVQKKGVYSQITSKVTLGTSPGRIMNLNFYIGYDYFMFRKNALSAVLFGVNVQQEFKGNLSYEVTIDTRLTFNSNLDLNIMGSLMHLLNLHIGKKEADTPPDNTVNDNTLKKPTDNPNPVNSPVNPKNTNTGGGVKQP